MNTIFQRFQIEFTQMTGAAAERFSSLLPDALLAIVIVFVGWIVAVLAHFLTIRLLGFFAIDKLAAKTPLERMLKGVGIHKNVSDMLAFLVFWLAILMALVIAADILALEQVSNGLAIITAYIPQVIAALLIVVIGMLFAKFLQMLSMQALGKIGEGYRKSIGKAVQGVVVLIVIIAAAEVLGFDLAYLLNSFVTFLSVLLLMLGLGAAIGARTAVDNAVACRQLKRQIGVGDSVSINETRGRVVAFTLTSVVLEENGSQVILPAVHFFTYKYTRNAHGS